MDLSRDVVERGAFARSLAVRGAEDIGLFLNHDAAVPIGRWLAVAEDEVGLRVEGVLDLAAPAGQRARRMIEAGDLDGLSIGYRTVRSRFDRVSRIRRLLEVELWEVSVVANPMLPEARLEATRTAVPATPSDDLAIVRMLRRGAASLLSTNDRQER